MIKLKITCVAAAISAATASLDANLVYRSPLEDLPGLAHDLVALEARHISLAKRQVQSAESFTDKHYPTFYGADFSNSPFIFSGGVNFTHSVASGDPFDTSVLLWTRAAPSSAASSQPDQSVPVCVSYIISPSEDLSDPIDSGEAFTSYDVDFTVKVEASNLSPDTAYFYQFSDCTNEETKTPVGKTRTLPSPDTPAESVNDGKPVTLAVFSCSQFQNGWFNAYGVAAQNTSADFFVHLGDYIYESLGDIEHSASIGRKVLGRELATVADYRQRLGQYRTDASLVAAHQNHPWITVWDDHEVADQSWKAGTADSNDTEIGCSFASPTGADVCFTDRKFAGVRAYHEWLPVRQVKADDKLRIWRGFQIGQLIDLMMLDTRQYDRDVTDLYYNTEFIHQLSTFENRSMMGLQQENWFFDQLDQSKSRGAIWRIVGQQVVFSNLELGGGPEATNVDSWDGYIANRARILHHIQDNDIDNVIVLAGDSHANWVSDLAFPNDTTNYDSKTGDGALGVEFAGTAVTSGSFFGDATPPQADNISACLVSINPDLQWSEGFYRGFFTLTVDASKVDATYYAMQNISFANLDSFKSANFTVEAGANKLSRPVAGGKVLAGALKASNATGNSSTSASCGISFDP